MMIVVKNLPDDAGNLRDVGSIPESGRSPGGGHGNPLQYSCLENPVDRGAWWAMVHRVTKNWAQLSTWHELLEKLEPIDLNTCKCSGQESDMTEAHVCKV